MMRILGLCFFPAFVPPSTGGELRLLGFYKELSRHFEVTLLTSTHYGTCEEKIFHGPHFMERRVPKDDHFLKQWKRIEKYGSGGDLSGPCLAACAPYPTALHKAFLEEYDSCDVIIHDFPFTIDYDIFLGLDEKPRVYNAHNCETILYQELHPKDFSRPIHDLVHRCEKKALENCDILFYCSPEDRSAFNSLTDLKNIRTLFVPHGIYPRALRPSSVCQKAGPVSGIFVGSGHPPNRQAARFIVENLAPQLPDIQFHIVGKCLPPNHSGKNVFVHGAVDEAVKSALMERAHFALNPMVGGSGSSLKVLDYFNYGLPVFSTAFGMRGISARPGIEYIETSLINMAQEIRKALADSESLAQLSSAGRRLVEKEHNWTVIAGSVAETLEHACAQKRKNPRRHVLVLNDYDPFASKGGGSTRLEGLYKAVARHDPVVFLCFSHDGTLQCSRLSHNMSCIAVPITQEHLSLEHFYNKQSHISINDILAGEQCRFNPYMNSIYGVLRRYALNIVLEHCYLVDIPSRFGDRFIYSCHNHETALKSRLLAEHPSKDRLLSSVARMEHLAVELAAATVTVCSEDAHNLLVGKRTAGPILVVPNGVPIPSCSQNSEVRETPSIGSLPSPSVVFVGSGHPPNLEAVSYILETIAPRCPHVTFHIIGSVCAAFPKRPRNVRFWHVLNEDTKNSVLESCLCGLNPMVSGSGSNVKLADYLAHGLFVLTTEFGIRGYPHSVREHVRVASLETFATVLPELLKNKELFSPEARMARKAFFKDNLSLDNVSNKFIGLLSSLRKSNKKKILFVTYRYTFPVLGGAEHFAIQILRALGNSDEFFIDVIAPEVSHLQNVFRFSEKYSFDPQQSAPTDLPNVRFARFALTPPPEEDILKHLKSLWGTQLEFDKHLHQTLKESLEQSGLTWGWGYPEKVGYTTERWAFTECGLHLKNAAKVCLSGYTPSKTVITAFSHLGQVTGGPWTSEGPFALEFESGAGDIIFHSSTREHSKDPRPLAFRVRHLLLGNEPVDLQAPTLTERVLQNSDPRFVIGALAEACRRSRSKRKAHLTAYRGPWSRPMDAYLRDRVRDYDLVITHNAVFAPPVRAVKEACRQGVPSLLIPHCHLDDDFYHFPDVLQACQMADRVLVTPRAACDFLASQGCSVDYFPIGCDTEETFTAEDIQAFRKLVPDPQPFVLVLGRKAASKNYQAVIQAVDALRKTGTNVRVVLIGPDDDGIAIESPSAVYLGYQPRSVVRGALMSCVAVCNMSRSESFGIVILEAWMAGKPPLVNKHCAAFQDLVIHGHNGFLISEEELASTVLTVLRNSELNQRLGENGKAALKAYDWKTLGEAFVRLSKETMGNS